MDFYFGQVTFCLVYVGYVLILSSRKDKSIWWCTFTICGHWQYFIDLALKYHRTGLLLKSNMTHCVTGDPGILNWTKQLE